MCQLIAGGSIPLEELLKKKEWNDMANMQTDIKKNWKSFLGEILDWSQISHQYAKLTINADFNAFGHTRWDPIWCNTQISRHIQARNASYFQNFTFPFRNWFFYFVNLPSSKNNSNIRHMKSKQNAKLDKLILSMKYDNVQ